jgi:hypothetical protein
MYTIYLLKNCSKSLSTLLKLFKKADIKTNIIIVDNHYAKILNSDKRVKEIPFVIDKIPTKKGLIPKNARIISMNAFIKNNCKPKSKCKLKCKPKKKAKPRPGSNSIGRVITYNPKSIPTKSIPTKSIPTKSIPTKSIPTKSIPTKSIPTKSIPKRPIRKPVVKMPIKRPVKKPIIKTIKRKDKSIDIILSAN